MMSTTAGGTVWDVATTEKDSDTMSVDYGGSDDDRMSEEARRKDRSDVVSQRSDATRISNSTSSDKKSIGRRTSRRKLYLERVMEDKGGEFTPLLGHEEYREQQRKNMVVITDPGVASLDRPAAEIIAENLKRLDEHKLSTEEMMVFVAQLDSHFRPKYSPKPNTKEAWDKAHYNMMVYRGNGQYWCRLCDKMCTGGGGQDGHTCSSAHRIRVEEQAAADEMCGEAKSARRFERTSGFEGVLHHDWSEFKDFWGMSIENMPEVVWSRLRAGTRLEIDMPHWGKKAKISIDHTRVCTVELAAATYPGQGKYDDATDRIVPFGKLSRLIEDDGFYKESSNGDKGGWHSPPGRGWWPVCMITWDTQHLDHGYQTAELYFRDMLSGRVKCYVICWYQLFDGTYLLSVWAVRIVSRL